MSSPPASEHPEPRSAVLQCYALARQQLGGGACIVALHLGPQHCAMAVGTGAEPPRLQFLELGLRRTVEQQFKTTPPTPLALETAIMVVEDVVMPLRALIPEGALLCSHDTVVHQIAQVSGLAAHGPMVLSLEDLERSFNRMSQVVLGSPAAHQGLPGDPHFAMALLILREFMQHLQFTQLTVLEPLAA